MAEKKIEDPAESEIVVPDYLDIPLSDVERTNLTKRRSNIRRWITNGFNALSSGAPSSNQKAEYTLSRITKYNTELLTINERISDEKVLEYVKKVADIVELLERRTITEEEKLLQQKRIENEKKKIEDEERKRKKNEELEEKERKCKIELAQLQIEIEKVRLEEEKKRKPVTSGVKLVSVPSFDSNKPCGYRQFEETFVALVENNSAYDDASKFIYFISKIGELEKKFAANLSPTFDNLQLVKKRLRDHYENPSRIRDYIKTSFEKLPHLRNLGQTSLLHTLIIAWEEGILALTRVGTGEEQINNSYMRLMTSHLPVAILKECDFKASWDVTEFLAALKKFYERQIELDEFSNDTCNSANRDSNTRTHMHAIDMNSSRNFASNSQPISPEFIVCGICNGEHRTIFCNSFDIKKRREIVEQKKLCVRCLRAGHSILDCRSKYVCRCGCAHSRVLCMRPNDNNIGHSQSSPQSNNMFVQAVSTSDIGVDDRVHIQLSQHTQPNTLVGSSGSTEFGSKYARPGLVSYYQTVVVDINGEKVRVLFDGGCGRSSILESCAKRLRLPTIAQQSLTVSGLGGNDVITSKSIVAANLCSIFSNRQLSVELSVLPTFGNFHPASIPEQLWRSLKHEGYLVSDTPDNHQMPIEIILGLEYIGRIWIDKEELYTDGLFIRQSIFGWTVFGVTIGNRVRDVTSGLIHIMSSSYKNLIGNDSPSSAQIIEEENFVQNLVKKEKVEDGQKEIENSRLKVHSPGSNLIRLSINEEQEAMETIGKVEVKDRKRKANVKKNDQEWTSNNLQVISNRLFSFWFFRIYKSIRYATPYVIYLLLILQISATHDENLVNNTQLDRNELSCYGKVAMINPGNRFGIISSWATIRTIQRGIPIRIYTGNGKNLTAVKKQFVRFLDQISETQPGFDFHVEWIQLTDAIMFGKTIANDDLATALYHIENLFEPNRTDSLRVGDAVHNPSIALTGSQGE